MPSVDTRRLLSEHQLPAQARQPRYCGPDASLIGEATYCYQTIAIGERSRKRTIAELYDSGHEPWLSCDEGLGQPGMCTISGNQALARAEAGATGAVQIFAGKVRGGRTGAVKN